MILGDWTSSATFKQELGQVMERAASIHELRQSGHLADAAREVRAGWDEVRPMRFSGYFLLGRLGRDVLWILEAVPSTLQAFESRARQLEEDLHRHSPDAGTIVGLAVLARGLHDSSLLTMAQSSARSVELDEHTTQSLRFPLEIVQLAQLGLEAWAGRLLPAPAKLFDDLTWCENDLDGLAARWVSSPQAADLARSYPSSGVGSGGFYSLSMAGHLSAIIARCLHAAGRSEEASAVVQRALDKGLESWIRPIARELGSD